MRTLLFFASAVAIGDSVKGFRALSPILYILRRQVRHLPQLLRLPSVQSLRDGKRRLHPDDTGIEVQFGDAFEAAGRAFLDADAAALTVVHENLVQAVGSIEPDDARFRAHQITVVACVARPAAEA